MLAPSSGQELAVRLALVLYIGYNAVAAVVSVPAGRAGDRWGAPPVLLVGVVAFLLAYLGFALTPLPTRASNDSIAGSPGMTW